MRLGPTASQLQQKAHRDVSSAAGIRNFAGEESCINVEDVVMLL